MRKIEIYNGKEIDKEKINKIKQIAADSYAIPIYESSYHNINNIDQLAILHDVYVEDEILILGEDWFLCYYVSENEVAFLEWVAISNVSSKFVQSIEMMNVFNSILFKHKNKRFIAEMRHDTSYQIYSKMLQRGYFEEENHTLDIYNCDGLEPIAIKILEYSCKNLEYDDSHIKEFLKSTETLKHPEYLNYILHCISFQVTDAFSKRYAKLNRKL